MLRLLKPSSTTANRESSRILMRRLSFFPRRSPASVSRITTSGYESFSTLDPIMARNPLSLDTSGERHREAIRMFLESLQSTTATNLRVSLLGGGGGAMNGYDHHYHASSLSLENDEELETVNTDNYEDKGRVVYSASLEDSFSPDEDIMTLQESSEALELSDDKSLEELAVPVQNPIKTAADKRVEEQLQARRFQNRLRRAIQHNKIERAMDLFAEAKRDNHLVPLNMIVSLSYQVAERQPFLAYELVKYYRSHPQSKGDGFHSGMYRKLCKSVALLDPQVSFQKDIQIFVHALLKEVGQMDMDIKRELYPKLVTAFVMQRTVSVGKYAGAIYDQMAKNDFNMSPGWLLNLLSLSKYNRQDDMPFHDVLATLVATGYRPNPQIVLRAIHNMFPFRNSEASRVSLQAILDLIQQETSEDSPYAQAEYRLDMGTLEAMSVGAAKSGDSKFILLLWDVMDQLAYKPTEAIYENTIIAFAASDNLENAFAAMASMEAEGFPLSRALVRSFSQSIRSNPQQLHRAFHILTNPESTERPVSVGSLNVVMSGYAERGDVHQAMRVLEEFTRYDLEPDVNTYSFAIEVLGKDLHRRRGKFSPRLLTKNIDTADEILSRMEKEHVPPSGDIIRNYTELLVLADEVSTATGVIKDVMQNNQSHIINNKTIYRVAMANAENGNFDLARDLAACTSEHISILHRNISSKEERYRHVESMKKIRAAETAKQDNASDENESKV